MVFDLGKRYGFVNVPLVLRNMLCKRKHRSATFFSIDWLLQIFAQNIHTKDQLFQDVILTKAILDSPIVTHGQQYQIKHYHLLRDNFYKEFDKEFENKQLKNIFHFDMFSILAFIAVVFIAVVVSSI